MCLGPVLVVVLVLVIAFVFILMLILVLVLVLILYSLKHDFSTSTAIKGTRVFFFSQEYREKRNTRFGKRQSIGMIREAMETHLGGPINFEKARVAGRIYQCYDEDGGELWASKSVVVGETESSSKCQRVGGMCAHPIGIRVL